MRGERGTQAAARLRHVGRVPLAARRGWVPDPPAGPAPTVVLDASDVLDAAAVLDAADVDGPGPEGPGPKDEQQLVPSWALLDRDDSAGGHVDPVPARTAADPFSPPRSERPQPSGSGSGDRAPRVSLRAAVAVGLLALAVSGGIAARALLSDAGEPVTPSTVGPGPRSTPRPGGSGAASTVVVTAGPDGTASASGLVVDVEGRVRRPGIVRLASGARVADALAAAGGAGPGAAISRVNLARRLTDGEQVVIPGPGDPLPVPGADAGGSGQGTGAPGIVDLNTATAAQLDGLPGVGAVTAQRIIAWRSAHQRFSRVEELAEVPGIGPKLLAQLKPLVRVS